MEIKNLIIQPGKPISDALHVIGREGAGVCFVAKGLKLVGIITDGDVRRALLAGANVNDAVEDVMKSDFFSLSVDATFSEIQKHISIYKKIPILNSIGEIVDLATPSHYHQIPLVRPTFDGKEMEYVTDCIMTGWVSSQGKYVGQFESNFAEFIGSKDALAVSNGTVALHLALVALGIGPGDEVLIPNLTFASPANAVLYVGATPIFVDVDPTSMAIDFHEAKKFISNKTRAIIVVHLYGYPAFMDILHQISSFHNLYVIEDCAEALGTRYQGTHVGNFGDAATFSFFGNKTITTGEGGMIIFRDQSLMKKAKILRDHGMSPDRRYWHDEIGYNYRLTNLQAALGVAQLERVNFFIERKRWIAEQYNSFLREVLGLHLPQDGGDVYNSYWLYTIILDRDFAFRRDAILKYLKDRGVEVRPVFYPLHRMPPYKKYVEDDALFPIANWLSDCGISLPSSIELSRDEIRRVCAHLVEALGKNAEY
jgi:perosamine synthetase